MVVICEVNHSFIIIYAIFNFVSGYNGIFLKFYSKECFYFPLVPPISVSLIFSPEEKKRCIYGKR